MEAPIEEIAIPATAPELGALYAALDRFWAVIDATLPEPPGRAWRDQFATAVVEIAGNIIRHAYRNRKPGLMRLRLWAYPNWLEARFEDHGVVCVLPPTAEDESDPLALAESGRGLRIVRAYLDRLDYRRTAEGANEWRLEKRLRG